MKKKKFKLKKMDIILIILAIVILLLALINYKFYGLLTIPLIVIAYYIYYNIDNIIRIFDKRKRKKKKKNIKTIIDDDIDELVLNEIKEEDVMKIKNKKKKNLNNGKKKKALIKNNKKSVKKGMKTNKKSLLKKVLICLIGLAITCIFASAAFFMYIVISTASFDPEALVSKEQTVVYDIEGNVIATLGSEKRENISYDKLPQVLVDAIIATEDSRFFQHNGLDMARFLKATAGQLVGNSSAGGASTLTMQVVKNNLTSTEKSLVRKFKDIYLSVFYLERKYTKEEILEFYVNDSLLGGSVFGVGQAAEYYFGKSVSELSLPEASLLAGMFQSPNGYNPYNNPEAATKRREIVLKLMVRHGYITQEEADIANSISVESLLVGRGAEIDYQGYIDTVVAEVEEKTELNPYTVPMKIYTNMEKNIQDGINSILSGENVKWENDLVQAGIAIVNVETGAVSAIGAGRNREGERTYNFATMSKRQPGSTAKPLFDYGPGFEYNNFSTYTLFVDEPWSYSNGKSIGNWDGGYSGLMTLRTALSQSRNIPALKAYQQVSKKNINTFVTSLGIEPEYEDGSLHEAHAIGGFTGVNPLQMAAAYAGFASMGYYVKPYTVSKIEYRSTGEVVEFDNKKEKVMSDSTAYLVTNVLEYATNFGFSGGANVSGSHVATKTGTSNYDDATLKKYNLPSYAVNDLWTVAYTSKYSVALWYGYDEINSEHYNTNNSPKGTIMSAIMRYIPKDTTGWEMPSSVVSSSVEFGSWPAQLPSDYTPADLQRTEYFKKGTQPTEISPRFAKLDAVTTLKSTVNNNSVTLSWKYKNPQVLDNSYLTEYFNQSIFGNSSSVYLNQRLSYNSDVLGNIGFGIYKKTDSGESLIGFTTDTTYNVDTKGLNGKTKFIVKAEYKNFKSNSSDGVEVTATISNTNNNNDDDDTTPTDTKPVITLGTEYSDIVVTYQGNDVTDECTISYGIYKNSELINTANSKSDLTSIINGLSSGDYSILYTVTYNNKTVTKTKNITIQ